MQKVQDFYFSRALFLRWELFFIIPYYFPLKDGVFDSTDLVQFAAQIFKVREI